MSDGLTNNKPYARLYITCQTWPKQHLKAKTTIQCLANHGQHKTAQMFLSDVAEDLRKLIVNSSV